MGTLLIVSLLNDLFLDGAFVLDPGMNLTQGNFSFAIDAIKVTGLDTITQFNVLEPTSPQKLSNQILLNKLGMELVLATSSDASLQPQMVNLTVRVTNVTLDTTILATIDLDKPGSLQLSQLRNTQNIIPYILLTNVALNLPDLVVTVGSFKTPIVQGLEMKILLAP